MKPIVEVDIENLPEANKRMALAAIESALSRHFGREIKFVKKEKSGTQV